MPGNPPWALRLLLALPAKCLHLLIMYIIMLCFTSVDVHHSAFLLCLGSAADFNFAFTCKKFEEVHYTQIFLYYTVKTVSPAELVSTARFKFFFKFLCNDIGRF